MSEEYTGSIVEEYGNSILIEQEGERRWLPAGSTKEEFNMGIPHGVPWAQLDMSAMSGRLADELKRRGIWTALDVRENQKAAQGAILSVVFPALMALAAQYEGGKK